MDPFRGLPWSEAILAGSLVAQVEKQWAFTGQFRTSPPGGWRWARVRNDLYNGSHEVFLRAGTLVEVEPGENSLGNVHIVVGELRTTVLARVLEPCEPPPTVWDRLLQEFPV